MDSYSPIPPDEQPLSTKDYSSINAALSGSNRARRLIDRAKAAGVPCEKQEQDCEFYEQMLGQLKQVYFPHKP